MAVLTRYSSVVAILPPFIVLLVLEYLSVQDSKKQIVEKICLVSAGWIVPLLLFFAYLVRHSAWNDFSIRIRSLSKQSEEEIGLKRILILLLPSSNGRRAGHRIFGAKFLPGFW